MLHLLAPQTCAFDCEWVPCPTTARRLLHLPADTSDTAAMQAVWAYTSQQEAARSSREPQPGDRPFVKLVLSKVVSIAAVLRQVDRHGQPTLRLYARSCAVGAASGGAAGYVKTVQMAYHHSGWP